MCTPGPGFGHLFRTFNRPNARAFTKEMEQVGRPERLPRTWAGRAALLVFVVALFTFLWLA